MNAHSFEKENKPTQGYLVCGLLVRGDILYIFPNTNAKKRFSDNQFTNSDTHGFLITLAFRSVGDTKSDFSLTEG